jgi:hypothetical protein
MPDVTALIQQELLRLEESMTGTMLADNDGTTTHIDTVKYAGLASIKRWLDGHPLVNYPLNKELVAAARARHPSLVHYLAVRTIKEYSDAGLNPMNAAAEWDLSEVIDQAGRMGLLTSENIASTFRRAVECDSFHTIGFLAQAPIQQELARLEESMTATMRADNDGTTTHIDTVKYAGLTSIKRWLDGHPLVNYPLNKELVAAARARHPSLVHYLAVRTIKEHLDAGLNPMKAAAGGGFTELVHQAARIGLKQNDQVANNATPKTEVTKKKKKKHGLNKIIHSVSHEIKKVDKLSQKIERPFQKVTAPLIKPITSLLTPIVTPVLAPFLPALSMVSQALNIVNPILTPVSILASGGTFGAAFMAVAEEQLSRFITEPIARPLNRILNPVGAIINDIMAPIAPVLGTIQQTQILFNNVSQITNHPTPSTAIKQPEKTQAEQKSGGDILEEQITSHFILPVEAAFARVLDPVTSYDISPSLSPVLATIEQSQVICNNVSQISPIRQPATASLIDNESKQIVQTQDEQNTKQSSPKQTINRKNSLKIKAESRSSKNMKNDSISDSLQRNSSRTTLQQTQKNSSAPQTPVNPSTGQAQVKVVEPTSKNQNKTLKLDISSSKAGLKGAGIKLPSTINTAISIANRLLDPNKTETITDVICGSAKDVVSGAVQGAVISTTATAVFVALPTPDPFSRAATGFIAGIAVEPLAEEISKPFENLADKACRSTLELIGVDKPGTPQLQPESMRPSANPNSFFNSIKTNTNLDNSSLGMQTGHGI